MANNLNDVEVILLIGIMIAHIGVLFVGMLLVMFIIQLTSWITDLF